MPKNTHIKTLALIVFALLLFSTASVLYLIKSHADNEIIRTSGGVSLLRDESYNVYASYNGFYRLEENREWKLLVPDIQGFLHQEVYFCDDYLYFFDLNDHAIKKSQVGNAGTMETVAKTEANANYISVSKDREKIAYSAENDIFVFSIVSNNTDKYQLPSYIHSIAWPEEEGNLLLGTQEGIFKLIIPDGTYERICDGTWVFVLPNNRIGYFDKKRYACFTYDLTAKEEKFLFEVDTAIIGMDWSEDGKYILTAHRKPLDFIRWGIRPRLHSVNSSKELDLPVFKIYTGCIFIKKSQRK